MRELVVLGTASQVPTRHRNHNGYLLLWDGEGVLFDPGEGTQRQMLYAGVSASQITTIAITHFHGDHCLGLSGIIQRISLDQVPQTVPVHYPASGQQYFDRLRRASIFVDKSNIAPSPITVEGPQARPAGTKAAALGLEAYKLSHTVPCWGYRLVEPDRRKMDKAKLSSIGLKGPKVGELLSKGQVAHDGGLVTLEDVSFVQKGQVIAFIMDTRYCDAAVELAKDADVVIAESTYLSSEQAEATERGHMTAAGAARVAKNAGAKKLVLTHFSQRYPSIDPFLEQAGAIHGDVVAASDGMRIPIDRGSLRSATT